MNIDLRQKGTTRIASWVVLGLLCQGILAQDVPPRTFAGKALEVPEAQLDAGMVYHLELGSDTQVAVTSDTPLQRFVLTANSAIGYILTPFDLEEGTAPLMAAAVRIPVVGLTAGLRQIDPMLQGPQTLKASEHPEITLALKKLNSFKIGNFGPDEMSYDLKLTAVVSMLGSSRDLDLEARLSFHPSSNVTMSRNVGDLAAFRTSLEIKAKDLGVEISPRLQSRVAEDLKIDVFFMFNTVSPDRSLDPRDDPAIHAKQLHFTTLLDDLKQVNVAYQYAREFSREIWDNPQQLTRLAQAMTSAQDAQARDLGFAKRLVSRALESSEQPDARALAAMSGIEEARGALSEAVQWLTKAVEAAPEERTKQGMSRRLQALQERAAAAGTGS